MCRISKISEDWVIKGCHLHVHGVELVIRPDANGGIVFKKWFWSTPDKDADAAIGRAMELLEDLAWRRLFFRELERARKFVSTSSGKLADLGKGRGAEFTFLLAALRRMGVN